ncbi:glutamate 5-kinase [Dendrothele bispora CBS 962.96]|uniref:Glutamate 5-kinase n=1 Tax=Dendrothele bispora (strain CBS 962.96) TaxID=1314807 RepID=A0A4S8MVC3_DENBC|nr:glutamate 5-kinase [Dendrothele bispora CBS 962.96]
MVRTRQGSPCTIVIKLGTSSIVHEKTHQPLLSILSSIVETVVNLRSEGHKVVLVSSGAIGVGLQRMNLPSRPKSVSGKQALAAIGQGRLIALWDDLFGHLGQPIGQVLLTRGDISDRTRYLNAVNTLQELLSMGVVPIVNENDTVSVSEIKFGDNDTLSAITSSMIHADYLFLLTDVDGLYTANPRKDPSAKQIETVTSISAIRSQVSTSTLGSSLGTGGMETKIIAAEIATGAGVNTIITSSKRPENIFSIIEYYNALKSTSPVDEDPSNANPSISLPRPPHTVFVPSSMPMRDLKSWTSHTLHPSGSVVIDSGAHRVLSKRESGGRLLPAGVLGVIGAFASGQAVRIVVRKPINGSVVEVASAQSTRPNSPTLFSAPLSRSGSSGDLTKDGTTDETNIEIPEFKDEDVVEVGRGLANYNFAQILKVKGLNSSFLPQMLGYADSEYVVENITIRLPP